jgi:hypothetical protein
MLEESMSGDDAKKKLRKKQLEQQKKEKEKKRKKVQEERKKTERKRVSGKDAKKSRLDELSEKREKGAGAAGVKGVEKGKRGSGSRAESREEEKKGSRLDDLSQRRTGKTEKPSVAAKQPEKTRKSGTERTRQTERKPQVEAATPKSGTPLERKPAEASKPPHEIKRAKSESAPRRPPEEAKPAPEKIPSKEPGKDPTDDWERFMADLIADVTDIDKMVEVALERMEDRPPSKSEAPPRAETRPRSKAKEKTAAEPPPAKPSEAQAPEPTREPSEPPQRQRAEFVVYGTTELDRTKSDLAGVKIKGQPFMQAAKKINRGGYVPVLLVEGQKVYGLKLTDRKDKGDLLGDVGSYWLGSTGTNRPATNLKPGTYIVDRKTLDVYHAPSGNVVGKIAAQAGKTVNEILISGDVGIFLDPVGRTPHRHLAFRGAIEGQQLVVVRVPHESDMIPREGNSFKLSEAFVRSSRYLGHETGNAVKQMAEQPIETALMSLTGRVGLYLFGTQAAMRLGTANAIALAAETPDALDVAARMYARVIGETGIMAALAALTKGAAAGVKAGARAYAGRAGAKAGRPRGAPPEAAGEALRRGAGEEAPPAREARPTEDPATARQDPGTADTVREDVGRADTVRHDVGRADTVRQDLGRAETVRAEVGGVSEAPSGRDFNYFRDNYFGGDGAKARKFLRNVYEGDLEAGIKGMEFRRRLDPYLEGQGGSMDAPALRELIRNVDKWYEQHFTERGTPGGGEPPSGGSGAGRRPRGGRPTGEGGGASEVYQRLMADKISQVEGQINIERARVVAREAEVVRTEGRKAWNTKYRVGETKRLYNLMERRHLFEMQRNSPHRSYYEQVKVSGIRLPDGGLLRPGKGQGRIADWAELRGDVVQLGDIKSSSAIKRSVQGGLKRPREIEGVFRERTEIARQHRNERTILDQARQQGGRVVFEGKDPTTGSTISFEVSPENVRPSRISSYLDLEN